MILYASDVHLAELHKGDKDNDSLKQKAEDTKGEAQEKTAPSSYGYVDEYRIARPCELSWTLETAKANNTFKTGLGSSTNSAL